MVASAVASCSAQACAGADVETQRGALATLATGAAIVGTACDPEQLDWTACPEQLAALGLPPQLDRTRIDRNALATLRTGVA